MASRCLVFWASAFLAKACGGSSDVLYDVLGLLRLLVEARMPLLALAPRLLLSSSAFPFHALAPTRAARGRKRSMRIACNPWVGEEVGESGRR